MKRNLQKNKGNFIFKKAVAKKMGITKKELDHRLALRDKKLKAMEEN
jgi:hypothetical protein